MKTTVYSYNWSQSGHIWCTRYVTFSRVELPPPSLKSITTGLNNVKNLHWNTTTPGSVVAKCTRWEVWPLIWGSKIGTLNTFIAIYHKY